MKRNNRLPRIRANTTCIDILLEAPFKCKACIERSNTILGARVSKQKENSIRYICEQPWNIDNKNSKFSRKATTYHKVWEHLEKKGYVESSFNVSPKKKS